MQPVAAIPADRSTSIKDLREHLGLTQVQMAERIGVSFATVNRWENGRSKPTALARQRLDELRTVLTASPSRTAPHATSEPPTLDFTSKPEAVSAVAEATRLAHGHLFNPAFATEISSIDPLPHQRIAVYEHMLKQSPLRFLLADDAGAGKTIMTGLYLREIMARQLPARVLVVPPAGLVGNWEREMRTLFRLAFRIVRGSDAKAGNPFTGPESDRVIVSIDTLSGERMFGRLREAVASGEARPYDLVVFDEAHKLSADRGQDFRVRKTDRYRLAEALAGLPARDARWRLGWSAPNILLLTATPHMGKDFPYYCLWRLLAPSALATFDAFESYPEAQRRRHFIRRTKEEMVRFDGRPLFPQRSCDTLSYELSTEEQTLYDATTRYIAETYNRARILNRSAARLAMSVFQRRLASSSYALMCSFERRIARLNEAISCVLEGRSGELERRQARLARTADVFESKTADEDVADDDREANETFEEAALGGFAALTLTELRDERAEVDALLTQARDLAETGQDSKFEKLRALMADPAFAEEKLIVFTEHRDTAEFLVHRLEGLGFAGRVAMIHGGLDYREREAQVDLFRRRAEQRGAQYLVATDAAGEGINLQFCWLMANYDVPWNPARLEQRMGRIHRYGQQHDPVVIVNLVAAKTREGRVLTVLLKKLEAIRRQLSSDKVFDVVGRLFENVALKDYFEMTLTENGTRNAVAQIESRLSPEGVCDIDERERRLYGFSDVRGRLAEINASMERETFRRILPGYVRRFVLTAAPLLDLRVEGDPGGVFEVAPEHPGAADELRGAMDIYPDAMRGRLTVHRPPHDANAIWLHPGEPVFERFSAMLLASGGREARRGAIFVDPNADAPYLFHLARATVIRQSGDRPTNVEVRLVGMRQEGDGAISPCPLEHILLLRGGAEIAPGSVQLAHGAREHTKNAENWLRDVAQHMAEEYRTGVEVALPERRRWIAAGFDHRTAELMARRQRLRAMSVRDEIYRTELDSVKEEQGRLAAEKHRALTLLEDELSLIEPGATSMIAHALVVPADDPEERQRHDAEVEGIAMELARAHEEASGATVHDVSRPDLARVAGLGDWPGFDLRSIRPAGAEGLADRAIEVKGRAGTGPVEVSENEWAAACNLRDRYWLYAVFDCATPHPRLVKVRDPFGRLLAKAKGSVIISASEIQSAHTDESGA